MPKVAKLAYALFQPFCVFLNEFAFLKICEERQVISASSDRSKVNLIRKKLRLQNSGSLPREHLLNYYIKLYSEQLGQLNNSGRFEERFLSHDELVVFLDAMVNIITNCQVECHFAGVLGASLVKHFSRRFNFMNEAISKPSLYPKRELLFIMFQLRTKQMLKDISEGRGNDVHQDTLYKQLFNEVLGHIIKPNEDREYRQYVPNFLATLVRFMQRAPNMLAFEELHRIMTELVSSEDLEVVTNSLPLYLLVLMHMQEP